MEHDHLRNFYDAVVVGKGAVGSFAAVALAASGLRVAHVAPEGPAKDERTTALLLGSVDLLKRYGVWPALAPKAAPLRTMRLVDATRSLFHAPETAFESHELGVEAFGYNVRNADLHAAFAERAAALPMLEVTDDFVTAAEPGPRSVRLTLKSGRVIEARLAVAADGRRSVLREAAGIAAKEHRYEQSALVVNLRHSLPHRDASTEFHTRTGPFTLVPLGPGQSSLVCVERPAVAESLKALSDEDLAREIERRSASILGRIEIAGPRQVFPLAHLVADRMAANRTALVGEAAHALPPIGAQGLNLSLRDVATLADLCATAVATGGDPGSDTLLSAYQRARMMDVKARSAVIDLVNRSLIADFLPFDMARTLVLSAAGVFRPLRHLLMRVGLGRETHRLSA